MSKMRSIPCRVEKVSDRVREFVASTEGIASDAGIVRVSGWRFNRYTDNPVFLWAHNRSSPPIGKGIAWGIKDGALRVRVEFPPEGVYPFADLIFRLFDGKFLNMVSVSWETLREGKPSPAEVADGCRWVSEEQELLELSAVPIGADPKALDVTGRVAEAVAARTLLPGDAALIRASMAGIGAWDALAGAIERAAPAAPPKPPAPAVTPETKRPTWIETVLADTVPGVPSFGGREECEALAKARGVDLATLADELRSLAIRLAAMADACEGEGEPVEEPPEFPEGKPTEHADGTTSPRGVESGASRSDGARVEPPAPAAPADAGAPATLVELARLYAGR